MPTPSDVATATGGAQAAGGLSATCFRLASPASAAGAAVLVAILAGTVAALSPLYHDPDSAPGAAVWHSDCFGRRLRGCRGRTAI
jgi:hypothetical protein